METWRVRKTGEGREKESGRTQIKEIGEKRSKWLRTGEGLGGGVQGTRKKGRDREREGEEEAPNEGEKREKKQTV